MRGECGRWVGDAAGFSSFLSNKWNLGIVGDEPDGYLTYQQEAERLILFMKQIYQHSGPFSFSHLHKHAAQQDPSFVFPSANKRQQKWKKLTPRPKGIVSKVTGSPRKTDVIAFSCLNLRDNKNQDSFGSWHQTPLSSGFFHSIETYWVFHSDVKQSLVNVSNPSVGVSSQSFTSSDFTYRMGSNSEPGVDSNSPGCSRSDMWTAWTRRCCGRPAVRWPIWRFWWLRWAASWKRCRRPTPRSGPTTWHRPRWCAPTEAALNKQETHADKLRFGKEKSEKQEVETFVFGWSCLRRHAGQSGPMLWTRP